MKYDLIDADGKTIVSDRYLLSMKDMSQIDALEQLADAGASSFKIEGRLKDVDYVKNVVSAYSQRLDQVIRRRKADYRRASWGRVEYHFQPDLNKTFNRGYTHYFLKGRTHDLPTMVTPKALGEFVGTVRGYPSRCPPCHGYGSLRQWRWSVFHQRQDGVGRGRTPGRVPCQ